MVSEAVGNSPILPSSGKPPSVRPVREDSVDTRRSIIFSWQTQEWAQMDGTAITGAGMKLLWILEMGAGAQVLAGAAFGNEALPGGGKKDLRADYSLSSPTW